MSECMQCIKNQFWIKFLPERMLMTCIICKERGIKYTKTLRYGGYFSILIYLVLVLVVILVYK